MNEEKAALPNHKTDVDTTSPWDNGFNERRVKSPADRAYYSKIYAYLDPEGNPDRKSSYSFIHHMISADGEPGAANFRALATGIATLNGGRAGTVLRGRDRQRVYAHLAAHYRDADREAPALMPENEVRSMGEFIEKKSAEIEVGAQVSWLDDEGENFGTVVEVTESKNYLVRQWKNDEGISYPTDEFFELADDFNELKSFHFINENVEEVKEIEEMEQKAIDPSADGMLVTWDTPNGPYFGDVLTVVQSGQIDGQPQGMVLEASEEKPVALVRVWMWEEDEWIPTNTTVVAYGDTLNQVDSLPNPMAEDVMPENENPAGNGSEMTEDSGVKAIDEIASAIAKMISPEILIKALAEAGVKIDPPAGFSNQSSVDNEQSEEQAAPEATPEVAPEVAEEAPAAAAPESTEQEEQVQEDAEPTAEPAAEAATETEEKSALTLNDLKEFQDLLRMI